MDLESKALLSEEVVRAASSGNAGLGIVRNNTPLGELQALPCDSDEFMLVMPATHEPAGRDVVSIDEVLAHDIIGLSRATSLMRQIAAVAGAKDLAPRIRMQVRGFDEVCRVIAAGLGLGILPSAGAAPHVKSMGRLAQIRDLSRVCAVTLRVYIVQPGLSKTGAAEHQLALLGVTDRFLSETYQTPLKVYCG